jgi:LPXTG-motif cell wall-anchored protein
MKSFTMTLLGCFGLLGMMLAPSAKATQYDQLTTVTFSAPVEIPGRVLDAGTYVFKLADVEADRNIVQIFNKNQTHLYATIIAIPDYRLTPKGRTVITFEERAAGAPEAIKAWFYPGDQFGQEFVYPKARAIQLAKSTGQTVPSMPNEMAANVTKPAKSVQEPPAAAMKTAPLKAQQPSGETEIAKAFPPKTPAPSPAPAQTTTMAKRLPQTGSTLPLTVVLGLLAFSGGLALRRAAKWIA